MTPELADHRARCFVNGVRKHSVSGKFEPATAEFHNRFLSHPWVRDSIKEGWDRELRGHLILTCRRLLMSGDSLHDVESLMPSKSWVDYERVNAKRYRAAAEWRAKQGAPSIDPQGLMRRFGLEGPEA